jgi:hypothetical protein
MLRVFAFTPADVRKYRMNNNNKSHNVWSGYAWMASGSFGLIGLGSAGMSVYAALTPEVSPAFTLGSAAVAVVGTAGAALSTIVAAGFHIKVARHDRDEERKKLRNTAGEDLEMGLRQPEGSAREDPWRARVAVGRSPGTVVEPCDDVTAARCFISEHTDGGYRAAEPYRTPQFQASGQQQW